MVYWLYYFVYMYYARRKEMPAIPGSCRFVPLIKLFGYSITSKEVWAEAPTMGLRCHRQSSKKAFMDNVTDTRFHIIFYVSVLACQTLWPSHSINLENAVFESLLLIVLVVFMDCMWLDWKLLCIHVQASIRASIAGPAYFLILFGVRKS